MEMACDRSGESDEDRWDFTDEDKGQVFSTGESIARGNREGPPYQSNLIRFEASSTRFRCSLRLPSACARL